MFRFARHALQRIAPVAITGAITLGVDHANQSSLGKTTLCAEETAPGGAIISHKAQERKQSMDQSDGSFGYNTLDYLCLIAGHGHEKLARDVSGIIGVPLADTTFKKFSDG